MDEGDLYKIALTVGCTCAAIVVMLLAFITLWCCWLKQFLAKGKGLPIVNQTYRIGPNSLSTKLVANSKTVTVARPGSAV